MICMQKFVMLDCGEKCSCRFLNLLACQEVSDLSHACWAPVHLILLFLIIVIVSVKIRNYRSLHTFF
jgi:hypothetical protein